MNDKIQQNQTPQNHNLGISNWSQQWQNAGNPFVQPRIFPYWPQWSPQLSVAVPGSNILPQSAMSFQSISMQNLNYPSETNLSNLINSNGNVTTNDKNGNICTEKAINEKIENVKIEGIPPLPEANFNSACNKINDNSKILENPDKIPLPEGPPPSNTIYRPPPPPPPPSSNIQSQPFYSSNSQPIKFNINLQNKSFTPFNLQNKNKRKKNQNKNSVPFASMFNKCLLTMNPTPSKSFFNSHNSMLPPLPPGNSTISNTALKEETQKSSIIKSKTSEIKSSSNYVMQNQQSSHDDWPPSLLEYIKRCYLKCETSMDKDQVGIILKGKITSAMSSNTLFSKNWDLEPLPNLRGNKFDVGLLNKTNNVNVTFRGRNKFGDSLKPRIGKNRNYRGSSKRSLSKSPPLRSISKSKSRSKSNTRSRSRSRSPSNSPKRRSKNSNSNSSEENLKTMNKSKSEKRNSRKSKRKQKRQGAFYADIALNGGDSPSTERLQQRAARFKETLETPKKPLVIASSINTIAYEDTEGDFEYNDLHIVGTCQDLEKPFLRLTSAPDASQVRPNDVLEKSLELIKSKWVENSDYRYTCEQLKSIRQDLTVQGIRNDFTVKVYETHARICLEKGDPEEFNQCQTQLRMLYNDLGGNNKHEFIAYRILYFIYTSNALDLTISIGSLNAEEKKDVCVKHALEIAHAWYMNNYHRFFWLYQRSPKMSSYLIDWFIERERKCALKTMIKAYRQSLPVVFVAEKLGFESVEKFLSFTSTFNLTYCDIERTKIDCKASMASLNNF